MFTSTVGVFPFVYSETKELMELGRRWPDQLGASNGRKQWGTHHGGEEAEEQGEEVKQQRGDQANQTTNRHGSPGEKHVLWDGRLQLSWQIALEPPHSNTLFSEEQFQHTGDRAHAGDPSLRNTPYWGFSSLVLWCVFASRANSGPDSGTPAVNPLLSHQLFLKQFSDKWSRC